MTNANPCVYTQTPTVVNIKKIKVRFVKYDLWLKRTIEMMLN